MDYNDKKSVCIKNLRFPLMLGVVLIHNRIIEPSDAFNEGFLLVGLFIDIFSQKLVASCVPLFFFFSGYLFFVKYAEGFSANDYLNQLRKRVRTLLVPFVFWNVIVIGYFALIHKFTPGLINSDFNNVYRFSVVDLIRSFWDFPNGQPICYQFWFLRDLIMMVILSPIIYWLLKLSKWYLLFVLAILYGINPETFLHQTSITFFMLGAGFAIHKYDFVIFAEKCRIIAMPLFLFCIILSSGGVKGILTISGALTLIYVATMFNVSRCIYTESGFFVYAFHGFPILILSKVIVKVFQPSSSIMWLICYLLDFLVITSLSIFLYLLLRRVFPNFTAIITGGR